MSPIERFHCCGGTAIALEETSYWATEKDLNETDLIIHRMNEAKKNL